MIYLSIAFVLVMILRGYGMVQKNTDFGDDMKFAAFAALFIMIAVGAVVGNIPIIVASIVGYFVFPFIGSAFGCVIQGKAKSVGILNWFIIALIVFALVYAGMTGKLALLFA